MLFRGCWKYTRNIEIGAVSGVFNELGDDESREPSHGSCQKRLKRSEMKTKELEDTKTH